MDNYYLKEKIEKIIKYLIQAITVGIVCYFLKLNMDEIFIISITSACTFAILDMYSPKNVDLNCLEQDKITVIGSLK
jgi:hypothetical protein